jgi:hypothetical protein
LVEEKENTRVQAKGPEAVALPAFSCSLT